MVEGPDDPPGQRVRFGVVLESFRSVVYAGVLGLGFWTFQGCSAYTHTRIHTFITRINPLLILT